MESFIILISIIVCFLLLFSVVKDIFLFFVLFVMENFKKKYHINKANNTKFQELPQSNGLRANSIGSKAFYCYEGFYRYYMFKVGQLPIRFMRMFIYRYAFKMNIGKKVIIHRGLEIRGGYRITIDDGTIIGDNVLLDGRGGLNIGKNVNFSSNASIYTRQHDVNNIDFNAEQALVSIEDRAWISSNTIVLPGVTIGEGTVLAAGGVAVKDLEPFSIYGGIPAKKIYNRNQNVNYNFTGNAPWFY